MASMAKHLSMWNSSNGARDFMIFFIIPYFCILKPILNVSNISSLQNIVKKAFSLLKIIHLV